MKKISQQFRREVVRFIVVGIINTAISFGIFNILAYYIIGLRTTGLYFLCNAVTFILVMIMSFFLNKHVTFRESITTQTAPWRFAVVTFIAFAINNIFSVTTFHLLRTHTAIRALIVGNISAVIGLVVGMCINFLGYKLFVFYGHADNK